MRILKKIDSSMAMSSLNDSLRDSPCYGVTLQSKYSTDGIFTINDIESSKFEDVLWGTDKKVNIHLFNQRFLLDRDYQKIAEELKKICELAPIILSSSHLARKTLERFRETLIIQSQFFSERFKDATAMQSRLSIVSGDDITARDVKMGDMIYSGENKSKEDREFDRLVYYINNGIPVILDWSNNNHQRISKMIEKTDNSDDLIVISSKPQTTRGIEKSYYIRGARRGSN